MTRRCWLALLLSLLLTVAHASAVFPPSANNSTLNAGATTVLTDSSGNGWGIPVSGGTVYLSGTSLPKTSHALQLAYVNSAMWYQSSSGWHSFTPAGAIASGRATTSPPTGTPPPPSKTPIVAPLSGTVTAGAWLVNQTLPFANAPSGRPGMQYNYLPFWQYFTGNTTYPVKSNHDSGEMAAIRAGTSQFYLINTNGGTAYGTFGCMNADGCDGTGLYAWLSSQKLNTTVTPPPSGTGAFKVVNGKIQAPNGTNWIGIGVDVHDSNLAASVNTILTDFPGVNLVRVDVDPLGSDPSVYAAAVTSLTSKGIVVEFSDYSNSLGTGGGGSQGVIFTGSLLTNELAWFTSMARYYKNNPYVWLGSDNEPAWTYPDGKIYTSGPNSLSAWQRASYDAVRATGNNAPFFLEPGGTRAVNASFPWLLQSMMDPTQYATMTNVIWDPHCYSYQALNSTDPAAEALSVAQMVAQSQTIHSADGVPAAIIGEYSTWGVGGTQNVTAVLTSGFGSGAWVLDANGVLGGPSGDPNATIYFGLLSGGRLTSFGRTVAAFTMANSRNQGTPPRPAGETLSLNTVSNVAQNTAFTVSGSIAGVSAAPPLQYQDNGGSWTTLPAGASVTASSFSFQHPGMASNPAATIAVRDANNNSISAIGPPFVVLGAPSANGTTVTPGVGSFTDGAHVYTVTAAGAAVQDGNDIPGGSGTSAGEWYNGLVYFQDAASKTWYTWNQVQLTATTAPGPVVTPPAEKPPRRPQGRRRPGIPQLD